MSKNKISICAVIGVRNEANYLRILLPFLAQQEIDVVIIDNESTDKSWNIFKEYRNYPIVKVSNMAYKEFYSLTDQLSAIEDEVSKLSYDWVIHHDADEILEHYKPALNIRNAIEEADENGFTVLNFDEFVFLPEPEEDFTGRNYYKNILRYYFFEPRENRLNRAWKLSAKCKYADSGGHRFTEGLIRISPVNHILRHYIVLGEDHAIAKYYKRQFDARDLKNRWHGNRRNISRDKLSVPGDSENTFYLKTYDSKDFCRSKPLSKHYWQWENTGTST
nr:glycosyltransferase family 2 protein [Bacteroidota bacterium]